MEDRRKQPDVDKLAHQIATDESTFTIRAYAPVKVVFGVKWWDIGMPNEQTVIRTTFAKELKYAELRGLLTVYPTEPNLVQFAEVLQ